jgi:Glycosyl transferase family 2
VSAPNARLRKLDTNLIPATSNEVRAFACIRDENLRLPFLLEHHRHLGVSRFFFIDNGSTDGSLEFLLEQDDCHVFASGGKFFAENVEPPVWSNALRGVYGEGHWCLSLDADEMFVYPRCEDIPLGKFCRYLDNSNVSAVVALVVDMYGEGAVLRATYERGKSFLAACPYFDPAMGHEIPVDGGYPPVLTFSRFRERAFWTGQHKKRRPPCITQVPLVKWQKGTAYLIAQHSLNFARLSDLQAAVLHFKFLPGFYKSISASLKENENLREKGLEERTAYVDTLTSNPDLTLIYDGSERYRNSGQLVELGWMKTSTAYEDYVRAIQPRRGVA